MTGDSCGNLSSLIQSETEPGLNEPTTRLLSPSQIPDPHRVAGGGVQNRPVGVEGDLVDLVLSSRDGDGPAGAGGTGVADVNLTGGPERSQQRHAAQPGSHQRSHHGVISQIISQHKNSASKFNPRKPRLTSPQRMCETVAMRHS